MNTKIVFLILLTICSSFQMRAIHTDQATDSKIQQAHETVAKTTLFQKTKNFLCSPYLRGPICAGLFGSCLHTCKLSFIINKGAQDTPTLVSLAAGITGFFALEALIKIAKSK